MAERRVTFTRSYVFAFDPEVLKARFPEELAKTLADGRAEEDFIRESVSMLTDGTNDDHLTHGELVRLVDSYWDDSDWDRVE